MSTTDHLDSVCAAISEGRPLVLLLGQDAWSTKDRPDPVLVAALKRSNHYSDEAVSAGYASLFEATPLAPEFYEWLAETYEGQPEAEWIEAIAALPLNAVFTTSIDPSLPRAFRVHGRDVEAVLSKEDSPDAPRHRRNLHMTYLFGRAGERLQNEAPPRNAQQLKTRTALHSTSLLARIVDTTTPLGILLIDGFGCGRDWLSVSALSGILSAFGPAQVYWFGWQTLNAGADSHFIEDLAAPGGPIVLVPERLGTALRELELAHRLDLSAPQRFATEDSVTIGEQLLVLSSATRLKTSTAASIVDDTWLAPLSPLGPDAEYIEFRRFHGHVEEARRVVDGIRRGFAIRRTFENELQSRVEHELDNIGRNQEPVLIHGQSSSGKSLALARLAYDIRAAKKHPVLLSLRASRIPAVDEVDEFCLRAEGSGATATLVICDANVPISRYRDLLRGLFSRGRKVVVVGSTYRIVDRANREVGSQSPYLLEVPPELDDSELGALAELFGRATSTTFRVTESQYLLPAIYRMLPDVRPRLAAGLAKEALVAEDSLRKRGKTPSTKPIGRLGQALIDAGIADPKTVLEERIDEFLGSMTDTASRAINFVMVPGKLGCPVPVNLLMRAVGGTGSLIDVAELFSGIDIFRWSSNDEGDVYVQPRLRIEAELISARRLGTSQAEANVAVQLLTCANPTSYGSCERRFVLDLVHKLGPDGPYGQRYASSYLDVARSLTEMRTRRGILDPSLMLQEATLRRRVLRDAPASPEADPAKVLEEARTVVDTALEEFGGSRSPGLRRMCANLKVERAAIYGFRAVQRLRAGAALEEVWQFYEAARDSSRSAISTADAYFAIDISLWTPNDLLRDADWDETKRAELIADIWDGLERIDLAHLDPDQRIQFEERRLKLSQTLRDRQLEQDALCTLEKMGSRAGIFLHARSIGGPLIGQGVSLHEDLTRATDVVSFMKEHEDKILDDARCLRYLLRSRWLVATGTYLYGRERSPLPTDDRDLRELLRIVELLVVMEGALGDPRTQYLYAVLQWRLLRENSARDVWRDLERDTAFSDPRRVVRHHVWTEAKGRPRLFHGRIVAEETGRGRARVSVEEIRQDIELLQRDFPDVDLRRGVSIPGGFHISFNFIGPVADPPSRYGGPR